MAYKCPLCLKELDVTDKLIRYCFQCDRADFVKGNAENLRNNLRCKKNGCKANGMVEAGVYFAHLDCEKANPFWDGDTLEIPENAMIDGIEMTLPFPKGVQSFKHWQINLLSKTTNSTSEATTANERKRVSEVEEMWFPGLILQAMQERREGKKTGQVVALIGTKKAGKTVLALQVLDEEGYISPNSGEKIEIEDYIYCTPLGGIAVEPIFELLRLRYLMWRNDPFFVPPPTVRETVNFYTAFYSPTKISLQKKKPAEENQNLPEQAKGLWGKAVGVWNYLTAPPSGSKKSFYWTLALFDVAGENFEKEVEQIEAIKTQVDKIAFVISATDLIEIGTDDRGVLAEHRRGLKKLRELGNKPFCVVLTKIDLFAQYLKTHPNFVQNTGKNSLGFYQGEQTQIKELLQNWKTAAQTAGNCSANLQNLLNDLIALPAENPIFFIETRNLPTNADELIQNQPYSFGLDTFVCWCLEIGREEIIEPR